MKVSDVGELGVVDLISRIINCARRDQPSWQNLLVGVGDDAAAWRTSAPVQLATTDSLLQDVHFTLATTTWSDLGWKALAVNLSDIAAMGGIPRYALVNLAVPVFTDIEDVAALYRGMLELAGASGVAIVGGDTDSAPMVTVTVTAIGESIGGQLLRRNAARPGDVVAVTGSPGCSAGGLRLLTEKLCFDPGADLYLKQAFLRPEPRIAEGQLLVREGVATAIDISDGLVSDLTHICQASRVAARLEAARIPLAPQLTECFGRDALDLALSGGEDYELLFTAPPGAIDNVRSAASCPVTVIGEILESDVPGVTIIDAKGNSIPIRRGGWEHFVT